MFMTCTAPETLRSEDTSLGGRAQNPSLKRKIGSDKYPKDAQLVSPLQVGMGTTPRVSLIGSIPSFMALTATQNEDQSSSVTEVWMDLAGTYMAQAVVEHGLKHGEIGPDVVHQAFERWDFDSNIDADEGSDEWHINALFWTEDGPIPEWKDIRNCHKQAVVQLCPPEQETIANDTIA